MSPCWEISHGDLLLLTRNAMFDEFGLTGMRGQTRGLTEEYHKSLRHRW
jgi:hypothetical protein